MAGQFCEEVKKRTNGRIDISYYAGGTLATGPKVFNSVVQGLADIGLSATPYNRGRFPVTEVLDLPHGFPSAWVSGQVQNDFYAKFKPKEWDDVQVLYFHSVGPFLLNTLKKQVKTLEDLKGLKIRAQAGIADTVKALGATPIPLEQADVYESLRRGVIDGVFGPFEVLQGWKFGELCKFTTVSWKVGSCATFYVVMNKQKYAALPADLKKIFDEVSAEYKDKFLVMWNQTDIDGRKFFMEKGGQTIPALRRRGSEVGKGGPARTGRLQGKHGEERLCREGDRRILQLHQGTDRILEQSREGAKDTGYVILRNPLPSRRQLKPAGPTRSAFKYFLDKKSC